MESFETLSFYRGMSRHYSVETPVICEPRKNRRPRNTPKELHERADKWFEMKFGVKYRSHAVLLTSNVFIARAYAASEKHLFRVIPLGPYKFCWSKNIEDMLSLTVRSCAGGALEHALNGASYIESNLKEAHKSGNEVMLYCEKYIAIPIHMLSDAAVSNGHQSKLIISLV